MAARKCQVCGKEYYSNNRYCSRECFLRALKRDGECSGLRECAICGTLIDTSDAGNRKYCSSECAKIGQEEYFNRRRQRGRWVIFNRDNFTCFYCGKKSYEDDTELHADHVVPRALGGSDMASNLVTSCSRCNTEKSATPILDESTILEEVARRNEYAGIDGATTIKL